MRIALLCTGLEHTKRGFESFSLNLFSALEGKIDVTLFKGSGQSHAHQVKVRCLRRDHAAHFVRPGTAYYLEQVSFAAAVLPKLIQGDFDVVHYSDGSVGNTLARLRQQTRSRFKLLLSNGAPYSPKHFREDIAIQQVSIVHYARAREEGISPARMHLVPYGIDPTQFASKADKEAIRLRYELPSGATIILSLAALNRSHKRLDHLIREVAKLANPDLYLCLAGERGPETLSLESLAARLLPGKCKLLTLDRQEIPDLLAGADMFVLPSLGEGFGMVLLEAMAAGLPVIAHDSEHFRWILGGAGRLVNMAFPGELARAIYLLLQSAPTDLNIAARNRISECFAWSVLVPDYIRMYEDIIAS